MESSNFDYVKVFQPGNNITGIGGLRLLFMSSWRLFRPQCSLALLLYIFSYGSTSAIIKGVVQNLPQAKPVHQMKSL